MSSRRTIAAPPIAMSLAEARIIAQELCAEYLYGHLEIGELTAERLRKLADEFDRCAPLLNADKVSVRAADAHFLRGLYEKISQSEVAA